MANNILRDEGSIELLGRSGPTKLAPMPVWQLLIIFGGLYPEASGPWGVAPLPRYFQREKNV